MEFQVPEGAVQASSCIPVSRPASSGSNSVAGGADWGHVQAADPGTAI